MIPLTATHNGFVQTYSATDAMPPSALRDPRRAQLHQKSERRTSVTFAHPISVSIDQFASPSPSTSDDEQPARSTNISHFSLMVWTLIKILILLSIVVILICSPLLLFPPIPPTQSPPTPLTTLHLLNDTNAFHATSSRASFEVFGKRRVVVVIAASYAFRQFVLDLVVSMEKAPIGQEPLIIACDIEMYMFATQHGFPVLLNSVNVSLQPYNSPALQPDVDRMKVSYLLPSGALFAMETVLNSGTDIIYTIVDTAWCRKVRPFTVFISNASSPMMLVTKGATELNAAVPSDLYMSIGTIINELCKDSDQR